jgi:hypothetical protein
MRAQILLVAAAGIIIAGLGLIHAIYALDDMRAARHLAPLDGAIQDAMKSSTIPVTRGRTTIWDGWMGFNITHGLGMVILGIAALTLPAIVRPEYLTAVLAVLTGLTLLYLATTIRFFFFIPAAGIAVATLLLLWALVVHVAQRR